MHCKLVICRTRLMLEEEEFFLKIQPVESVFKIFYQPGMVSNQWPRTRVYQYSIGKGWQLDRLLDLHPTNKWFLLQIWLIGKSTICFKMLTRRIDNRNPKISLQLMFKKYIQISFQKQMLILMVIKILLTCVSSLGGNNSQQNTER